jgi:type I restriction enzyme S subunit
MTYLIQEKPINWNINESVFTIRPNYKKVTSEFLLMLLSSSEMKAFTKNQSYGSIHKGIRHGVLKTFKLPYHNSSLINDFSTIIKPILKRIYNLDTENQHLSSLRDWLLPMLMNGQVKVS